MLIADQTAEEGANRGCHEGHMAEACVLEKRASQRLQAACSNYDPMPLSDVSMEPLDRSWQEN